MPSSATVEEGGSPERKEVVFGNSEDYREALRDFFEFHKNDMFGRVAPNGSFF